MKSIVIVIRQLEHYAEALATGRALQEAGAAVELFCLCDHLTGLHHDLQAAHESTKQDIACDIRCANRSRGSGFSSVPITEIAERIRTADMVIPY